MAELVTLSGNYLSGHHYNRRAAIRRRGMELEEELMGGMLDFLKSAGEFVATPFVAVGKGVGHFSMEAYRGVSRGDWGRALASPFRGLGHMAGVTGRTFKEHSEFYWRPSKMKDWMPTFSAAFTSIGMVPGPHSIFFIPIGVALGLGGMVGTELYNRDQRRRNEKPEDDKFKFYMAAAAVVVGGVAIFTMTR